jgi:thiamine kinase-like enzyme
MQPAELESLAAHAVPGSGPVEFHRLGCGLVNESYRVRRDGRLYALRITAANPGDLGTDRGWESRVLELAGAAGLAPRIEYCDPSIGIMVSRWVSGRSWTPDQAKTQASIAKVADLLRRIQALPLPSPARIMSPAAWILYYREALARGAVSNRHLSGLRSCAEELLASYAGFPAARRVLCHSDLHPMNLVDDEGSLLVLDWEYTHVSDPLWDAAGWSSNNDFGDDERRELLRAYLGRKATQDERQRLEILAGLYDYICLLWCGLYLYRRPDGADDGISQRMNLLAARLHARPVVG